MAAIYRPHGSRAWASRQPRTFARLPAGQAHSLFHARILSTVSARTAGSAALGKTGGRGTGGGAAGGPGAAPGGAAGPLAGPPVGVPAAVPAAGDSGPGASSKSLATAAGPPESPTGAARGCWGLRAEGREAAAPEAATEAPAKPPTLPSVLPAPRVGPRSATPRCLCRSVRCCLLTTRAGSSPERIHRGVGSVVCCRRGCSWCTQSCSKSARALLGAEGPAASVASRGQAAGVTGT